MCIKIAYLAGAGKGEPVGGFGVRGTAGKIECIRHARCNGLPYLGICLGFQMAVIKYARNVCGLDEAGSTEIDPDCKTPVISILPEQKEIEGLGGNMRLGGQDVEIAPGTLAAESSASPPADVRRPGRSGAGENATRRAATFRLFRNDVAVADHSRLAVDLHLGLVAVAVAAGLDQHQHVAGRTLFDVSDGVRIIVVDRSF